MKELLRRIGRGLWNSGDLVIIAVLVVVAGGVMSGALLSRDFLVATDLKNASAAAAIKSLGREQGAITVDVGRWSDAAAQHREALILAMSRRADVAVKVAEANYTAGRILAANSGAAAPEAPSPGQAPASATASILAYCATRHGCSDAPDLLSALGNATEAEREQSQIEAAIAARKQALRDIETEMQALQTSTFYPDGLLLAKREVRYALQQWSDYAGNPLLRPFVIFASAPIFILNLALCATMGATGAAIAYLLARMHPQLQRPNFVVTLMLGALASATIFLIYSAGLGVITASSTASLTFPDPLFVTGISLIAGFNASAILRALAQFAEKLLPTGGAAGASAVNAPNGNPPPAPPVQTSP